MKKIYCILILTAMVFSACKKDFTQLGDTESITKPLGGKVLITKTVNSITTKETIYLPDGGCTKLTNDSIYFNAMGQYHGGIFAIEFSSKGDLSNQPSLIKARMKIENNSFMYDYDQTNQQIPPIYGSGNNFSLSPYWYGDMNADTLHILGGNSFFGSASIRYNVEGFIYKIIK